MRLYVDTYGFAGMVQPRIRGLYPALLTDAATVGTAAELLRTTRSGRETPRSLEVKQSCLCRGVRTWVLGYAALTRVLAMQAGKVQGLCMYYMYVHVHAAM